MKESSAIGQTSKKAAVPFSKIKLRGQFQRLLKSMRQGFKFTLSGRKEVIIRPGDTIKFDAPWIHLLASYMGTQMYARYFEWDGRATLPTAQLIWPDLFLEFSEQEESPESELGQLKVKIEKHKEEWQAKIDIIKKGIEAVQAKKSVESDAKAASEPTTDEESPASDVDEPAADIIDESQVIDQAAIIKKREEEISAYEAFRIEVLTEINAAKQEADLKDQEEDTEDTEEESPEEIRKKEDLEILLHLQKHHDELNNKLAEHEEGPKAQQRYFKLLNEGRDYLNREFLLPLEMLAIALEKARVKLAT